LRSFQLNEEASLLLHDKGTIGRLQEIQRSYLADSDEILLEHWLRRTRLRRLPENIARIMSPLL